MVMVCAGPNILFGWADNRKMVHYFELDYLNNTPQGLNSQFFKVKGTNLPFYFTHIGEGGRGDGFVTFLRELA